MDRLQMKLNRFMQGRYGADELNLTLLVLVFVLDMAGIITGNDLLPGISLLVMAAAVFRSLSKNIIARAKENRIFLEKTVIPRRFVKAFILGRKDQQNRYYLCPSCHKICRVPKGKGKVSVHCPVCGTVFDRKS